MKNNSSTLPVYKSIFPKIFLLIVSAALFWLSRPNVFFENGLAFLAWFSYLPVLYLIKRSHLGESILFGALDGVISYGLFGYWLQSFHPLGLIIACTGYLFICAFLFFVLKWADLVCIKNGWLLQFFCLCGYEYLKTLGFFGISYGVTAYTQWKFSYFIQICSLVGVFGLNLLVIFPSVFLFSLIYKKQEKHKLLNSVDSARKSHISA